MRYDRSRIEEFKNDLDLYGFVVAEDLISADDADRLAGVLESLVGDRVALRGDDLALRGVLNHMDPADYGLVSPLLAHPLGLELARHALGEPFQIVEVTALAAHPLSLAWPCLTGRQVGCRGKMRSRRLRW